jgi:hypothetical protein
MRESYRGCLHESAGGSDARTVPLLYPRRGPNTRVWLFGAAMLVSILGPALLVAQQPPRARVPLERSGPVMPGSNSGPWAQVLAAHSQLRDAVARLVNAPAGSTVAFRLASNGRLSAIVAAPQQGQQNGVAPIGVAVMGFVDGRRPLRAVRLFLARSAGGHAVLQLRGQDDRILWQGVSQGAPESSESPSARPIYIPQIVCYESLSLSGGPMPFVPASEEGDPPTEITCIDLGWVRFTGNLRTVGSWPVPYAAVTSGAPINMMPGGELHTAVQALLYTDQTALRTAVAEPGIGAPVAVAAASVGSLWNGVAGLLPNGRPMPRAGQQTGPTAALLTLIQGRALLTRVLTGPSGCSTQAIEFQPNGQALPPGEGSECTRSQGASSGNQPFLLLTRTGIVVGEPEGNWITIKCCSSCRKGCSCC